MFDKNDGVDKMYVNGAGGGPVAVYDNNNSAMRYYFIKDQIGNTRVMVGDTGKVVFYTNYYPFGNIQTAYNAYDEPMKFTGKEWDKYRDFEYDYFGARYYDPDIGMFSSVDKAAQLASGFNYCGNNPVMMVDEDGNIAWFIPIIIGAVMNTATNSQYIENFGDFAAFMGIGALGGAMSMIGNPGAWYGLQSVLVGAAQGGITGGLTSLAQGRKFGEGFGVGAGIGAAFGLVTSEQFKNTVRGKGWESNQGVLEDFVSNQDYKGALDYFGFEGKYEPSTVAKFENSQGQIKSANAVTNIETRQTSYNTRAFENYDKLAAVNNHESFIRKELSKMNVDMRSSLSLKDVEFQNIEFKASIGDYMNKGLFRDTKLGSIGQVEYWSIPELKGGGFVMPYQRNWWHFIFDIPRRYGSF